MVKPTRLKQGATVGIVSPSSGAAAKSPHIFENGLIELRRMGLRTKELPNVRADNTTLYNNPRLRADDINAAFSDPEIDAIITSIGGDDSVRILPYIDVDLVMSNPKPIMGMSDATTVLSYLASVGMVTLYGPSIMVGFSQISALPDEFRQHVRTILFEDTSGYRYSAFSRWSEGYPEWSDPANVGKVHNLRPNSRGWKWLQGERAVRGRAWGGCIDVLEDIKGTRFWPSPDFWINRILLFETSEVKPTVDRVSSMIRNYGMQGILGKAAGIVFARARDYSENEKEKLEEALVRVVAGEFGRPDMPIVANVDFGHTDPQLVFPLGPEMEIDPRNTSISLIESALS